MLPHITCLCRCGLMLFRLLLLALISIGISSKDANLSKLLLLTFGCLNSYPPLSRDPDQYG